MKNNPLIFVDSDAFVAIVKDDDSNHLLSLKLLDSLLNREAVFVTSNYVFSESVTVMSQRVGRDIALKYIEMMGSSSSPYSIQWIDEFIHNRAIEVFSKQGSKNTSFVDCTNMVITLDKNVDAIFSFDDVYRKNGFTLVSDMFQSSHNDRA